MPSVTAGSVVEFPPEALSIEPRSLLDCVVAFNAKHMHLRVRKVIEAPA
ncbi:hypothetical protein AWB74_08774 [Caballeronia arvi]|uniref:Uncharacterized protein n=1 Tax=Caballeronia arvi TaxID=1777135 RepID=A0A158L606_9BURK|nr:hypothetical protein AWB74_08774 [Caballeronia arvi]